MKISYFGRWASRRTLLLPGLVLAMATASFAQNPYGSLQGSVTDPSGAVIPQATVTVTGASGKTSSVRSDAQGAYQIGGLAPGSYSVSGTAKGFAGFSKSGVAVVAGQTLRLDLALAIATQQEKVEVEEQGTTVDVNPENNASALIIKGKDLDALSDDPDELQSELQALAGPSAGPSGGQIYIDGFTGGQIPPKASIREIRINQNPFSAQYDKLGYGRIEIFTKPGTNQFHGQAFITGNDSSFDALWSPVDVEQPNFYSEQFSGSLSGPLTKKGSFFFNAEQRSINSVSIIDATVPSAQNPFPSGPNFSQAIPDTTHRLNLSPRVDFQLSPNNTLMIRYQFTHNSENNQGIGQFSLYPSEAYNGANTEHTLQMSDTQVLGRNVVNETRFQYIRDNNRQSPLLNPLLTTSVTGAFTSGGNTTGLILDYENHYELQNYTSIVHGNHFVKFGGRLRDTTDSNQSQSDFNGMYIFPSLSAYDHVAYGAACTPTAVNPCGPSQFSISRGSALFKVNLVDAGLYAEDDWKIRSNLTLSYGLRFETQNNISDHADLAPRLTLSWGLGAGKKTPPKTVLRAGYGIFYDRFTYDLVLNTERLNPDGTGQTQYVVTDPSYYSSPTPSQISSLIAQSSTSPTYFRGAPDLRAPYTMQAAFSVERQVTKSATVSLTYLNSRGEHQFFLRNINAPYPADLTGPRPYANQFGNANVFEYDSQGIFRQNQLIANFRVSAGKRVSLFGFYSLNYAEGDLGAGSPTNSSSAETGGFSSGGSTITPEFLTDSYNPMEDYGRSLFDTHQRVLVGGSISLPYGLRLSPFMVADSGGPYNLTVGQDLYDEDTFNDRPAQVSSARCATRTIQGSTVVCTPLGTFDTTPGLGQQIGINQGTAPTQVTLNLRLSKTIGFGKKVGSSATSGGGGPPGGGGRGGPPGGGLGGRGLAGGGGGGGGPFSLGGSSGRRYSLTLSVSARNSFNRLNLGAPVGDVDSPQVGQYNSLASGPFSSGTANRRIDLQAMFSF